MAAPAQPSATCRHEMGFNAPPKRSLANGRLAPGIWREDSVSFNPLAMDQSSGASQMATSSTCRSTLCDCAAGPGGVLTGWTGTLESTDVAAGCCLSSICF